MASLREALAELKSLSQASQRHSDRVIELWHRTVKDQRHKLGDDFWQVMEQVCLAALDCNQIRLANNCIEELANRFPDSVRVKKLRGMSFEANEKWSEALSIYDEILSQEETNSVARKRKVAIKKARGELKQAIAELNSYLQISQSDLESWLELSDLYLLVLDYQKAAFSIEEAILINPHHHAYYQRYAEILYTQSGLDNVEKARAYFAQSIKLNANNIRSLYGFYLSAVYVATHSKTQAKVRADNLHYAAWAVDRLRQQYDAKNPELSPFKTAESSPFPVAL